MVLSIRRAAEADAAPVAAVLNGVIAEGLTLFDERFTVDAERAFIASLGPRSLLHVADVEGRIVGVQSLDRYSNWAESLRHVATMGTWLSGDARGRGIGRALAIETLAAARALAYSKVVVTVLYDNHRALRFYRALGFQTIGVARQHVRRGDTLFDEVFLELLL